MNWDALGAIAELAGAAAVVVTLLYLSRQLREHTKSIKLQSLDSTFKEWNEHLKDVQSGEGAGLAFFKTQSGETLTALEEHQLSFLLRRVFNLFAKVQYLKNAEAIDEFNSASIETRLPALLKMDFFENWWAANRDAYTKEFQQYIDNCVKQTNERASDREEST